MKKCVLLILLYTIPILTFSNKYYISSTGNDANSGLTQALAWQTISRVNSFLFSAGDTIAFEGGSTFAGHVINPSFSNATALNRITITSYGYGWATISSDYYEEGISIVNAGNITVSRLFLRGIGTLIDSVKTIYYNGIGVWLDSGVTMNADNIIIDSIDAAGYGGFGIMMSCHSKTSGYRHTRITNSSLHDNNNGGIQITGYADSVSHLFSHSDVYIGYCMAYNNFGKILYKDNWSGCGILVSGLEGGLVEYCVANNNGKENGSSYAGPVGIFVGDAKFVTIQHCISHHNLGGPGKRDGGGFDLDQGSSHCVIQNCESYDNEGAGYGLYQAPTSNPWEYDTIRNNTSYNDGRNLGVYGAFTFWGFSSTYRISKAQIYNNQITLNKPGYGLKFLNSSLSDIQVYDNIFCLEGTGSYLDYSSNTPIPSVATVTNSTFPCSVQPRSPLITPVTYRGAFAPSPTPMWTSAWTNYDPQNFPYPATDSIIQTNITTNITLSGTKKYLLKGLIYVTNNAILTIKAGCILRGDYSVPNSSLIITKGAKIKAAGTSSQPIIFTSGQPAGSRSSGDWGGLIILGKSHYNGPGGEGFVEGISPVIDSKFGGGASPVPNDNSGLLQFVRIEYAGSSENIHGLMLASVGSATIIDHIQVSYCENNAFQFVGGSANCQYLVAYKNRGDNWNAKNGYTGAVQFCLGLRDPSLATDPANTTSESLESLNDETGSNATAFTAPLFCNVTEIGPLRGNTNAVVATGYKRGFRFRNNSHLKIVNSILMDFPSGVFVDGPACTALAQGTYISPLANKSPGKLVFKNNLIAGSKPGKVLEKNETWNMSQWFSANNNDSLPTSANILIAPYTTTGNNIYAGDYRPSNGSAAQNNYNWNDSAFYTIDSTGSDSALIACPTSVPLPATIIGNATSCSYINSGDTAKYYVQTRNIYGILGYKWSVPAGVTIESGQGSDTVVVRYSSSFSTGNISVQHQSYCGVLSSSKTFAINKNKPPTPGTITGLVNVCQYINGAAVTYSIAPVTNATGYLWTVPPGATITSPQPFSTSITVTFSNAFVSGNIGVQALGACGNSAIKTLAVTKGIPSTPGTISGLTNVCQYIGAGAVTYSIAAVTNATGYTWTVPAGATITSSLPYSTSITVSFNSSFVSGNIGVQAMGLCGNSAVKTLAINKGIPSTPGTISGLTNVCQYIGGGAVTYSIAAVTNATGYTWTVPTGATITSSQPYSTSITVTFSNAFVSGNIGVKAMGLCGNSAVKTLAVTKGIPSTPGTISGLTNVCQYIGAGAVTYSIAAVTNATGYTWTVPAGATITSPQPYSTSITVTFNSSFVSGNIGVQAMGLCGNSAVKTLAINKGIPSTPGTISGLTNVCQYIGAGAVTYSIAAVTNATGYTWTVPSGATITSPQPYSTSITVTFNSSFVSGNIGVQAMGLCGISAVKTLAVTKGMPATPGTISGPSFVCPYVEGATVTYSIPVVTNATGYNWTVPTGSTITSSPPYSTSINVAFSTLFVSGNISVQATSACGNSTFKTIAVTKMAATPTTLTGPTSSCKYAGVQVTYSTNAVANASSYTWTVPTGATISGSNNGTSINVTYPNALSGTVTVKANTSCGSSTARSLNITSVATPMSISGTAAVCKSQTQSYTVNDTANAASALYTWTPPTGATILSGQGTKTISLSIGSTFTSGNLGVKATACGITGSSKTLALTLASNCPAAAVSLIMEPQPNQKRMEVYPNPSNGNFTVTFQSAISTGTFRMEIISATGKIVSERTIANYNGQVQLKIRELNMAPGMYFIRCTSGKITETQKLVIHRF